MVTRDGPNFLRVTIACTKYTHATPFVLYLPYYQQQAVSKYMLERFFLLVRKKSLEYFARFT